MCNSAAHNARPNRESLTKRLGLQGWAIRARDGEVCVYCGADEASSGAHMHLDHVDPSTKGTPAGDCAGNLVVACTHCNSSRKDLPLTVWARRVAEAQGTTPAAVKARVRARLAAKLDLAAGKALKASKK